MRKQQWRIANGGAVARASSGGRDGAGRAAPVASAGASTATRPEDEKAATAGIAGASSDCWPLAQCAWHNPGWPVSVIPVQPGISPCAAWADMTAIANCGHAYAATASCANSRLRTAINAAMARDVRGNFMMPAS